MKDRTVKQLDRSWYFTPIEWSRTVGMGEVPDERNWDLLTQKQQNAIIKLTK